MKADVAKSSRVGGALHLARAGWDFVPILVACLATACSSPPRTAPRDSLADTRPPRLIRYWEPFACSDLEGAYTSATFRDGLIEVWFAAASDPAVRDDRSRGVDVLAVRRGPSLAALGEAEVVLSMPELIADAVRPTGNPKQAPDRAFSRTFIMRDDKIGYVGLVCSYPEYGRHLHPGLIVSETGARGTWRYLGALTGEPADEVAKRRVWSDGGSILRLPDKRWRIYTNGYGEWNGLVALEADTLAGPWRFLRDKAGRIRMLTPNIPTAGGQCLGIFPNVLRVSDAEWHLWMSDRWVPDSIWHFSSTDGLTWTIYGRQPEIVRDETEDHIKCMRTFLAPDGQSIVGMLSVAVNDPAAGDAAPWVMHWSRLPVGRSPR